MRDYWILWTYVANYSNTPIKVQAESAEQAARKWAEGFSADFRARGKVYVFEREPACVLAPGGVVEDPPRVLDLTR